jgi:hypothetical protein
VGLSWKTWITLTPSFVKICQLIKSLNEKCADAHKQHRDLVSLDFSLGGRGEKSKCNLVKGVSCGDVACILVARDQSQFAVPHRS